MTKKEHEKKSEQTRGVSQWEKNGETDHWIVDLLIEWLFELQSVSLKPVIWETLYSEVICMGISFLVFIPDVISIASAMFSLISVNLG